MVRSKAIALLLLLLSTWAGGARAQLAQPEAPPVEPYPGQLSSKFRINPDDPEASVPSTELKNKNPLEYGYLVQDLLANAEQARKLKDYAALVRYYRAVAKAVPEMAKGWSKLCEAYRLIADYGKAARACRFATERPGAETADFVDYATLTMQQAEPLTPEQQVEVDRVIAHLDGELKGGVEVQRLRCQLGVKTQNVKLLEGCTAALAKAAPDDPKTIVYQWDLAVRQHRGSEAARLLSRARELGLPAETLDRMEKFTPAPRARWVWVLAAVVLLGFVLSRTGFRRIRRFAGLSG
jgi:hypothetical protein